MRLVALTASSALLLALVAWLVADRRHDERSGGSGGSGIESPQPVLRAPDGVHSDERQEAPSENAAGEGAPSADSGELSLSELLRAPIRERAWAAALAQRVKELRLWEAWQAAWSNLDAWTSVREAALTTTDKRVEADLLTALIGADRGEESDVARFVELAAKDERGDVLRAASWLPLDREGRLQVLNEGLASRSDMKRQHAARAAASSRTFDETTVSRLIDMALIDMAGRARERESDVALHALRRAPRGTAAQVAELTEMFHAVCDSAKASAVAAVGAVGTGQAAAETQLCAWLSHDELEVRRAAAVALRAWERISADCVAALEGALISHSTVRVDVVETLLRHAPDVVASHLVDQLQVADWERIVNLDALAQYGSPSEAVTDVLRELSESEDFALRGAAAAAVWRSTGDADMLERLVTSLVSAPSGSVRIGLARALVRLARSAAVCDRLLAALVPALSDPETRGKVVDALRRRAREGCRLAREIEERLESR